MYAKIQPVTIFPSQADILYCSDLRIQNIGNFATVQIVWELQSSSREVLKSGSLIMNSEDYNSWGDDNSYIFNWIANKLNLTVNTYEEDIQNNEQFDNAVSGSNNLINTQITDSVTQ